MRNGSKLFDEEPWWKDEWQDMPEYLHEDTRPVQKIVVNFATREDVERFSKAIGQPISKQTDTIWFPKKPKWVSLGKAYIDES